jgi:hypothetical protein
MVESPEIVRGRFQWESQWELRKVGLAICWIANGMRTV